jgi:hypothetical protein
VSCDGNCLYLYGIVAGSQALELAPVGLAGAPVTLLPCKDIAAAVSAVALAAVRPEPAQLWCHERVVEALMVQRSTLPARFGTVLSSAGYLLQILTEGYTTFVADLERLAGQVEMGLRVLWDPEAVRRGRPAQEDLGKVCGSGGPGATYLRARAEEAGAKYWLREQAQVLEAWCRERLGPQASEMTTRLLVTAALPVSAAFLLPRAAVPALVEEAAQMQRERHDLTLVCTGPWPPYHFVTRAG